MRPTLLRPALGLVLAAVLLTLVPGRAEAQVGVGAFPEQIVVDGALRGGDYVRTLGVINDAGAPRLIAFEATGDLASWVRFVDPDDGETELQAAVVPPGGRGLVLVEVAVPDIAANGSYEGRLRVLSSSPGSTGVDTPLALVVEVPLVIDVVGTQTVDASITATVTADTEVGVPLRFTASVENRGNVTLHSELVATFFLDGEEVDQVTVEGAAVPPGSAEISGEWDTTTAPEGDFVGRFTLRDGGEDLSSRDARFTVFPRGHFTRQGRLLGLTLTNRPEPGEVAVVRVEFANIGQVEARAVFVGELARDGERIEALRSLERLLAPGESGSVELFLDVPVAGNYTVSGVAEFGSLVTDQRILSFRVGAEEPVVSTAFIALLISLGAVAVAGGVVWGVFALRRRRSRRPSRPLHGPVIGHDHPRARSER